MKSFDARADVVTGGASHAGLERRPCARLRRRQHCGFRRLALFRCVVPGLLEEGQEVNIEYGEVTVVRWNVEFFYSD